MCIQAKSKICIVAGDITTIHVDAIVNAANSQLSDGSGVNGAIHRAGGPTILQECQKIIANRGICPTGKAVITSAGNLPAQYVIHAVGPIWRGGSQHEEELLAQCYYSALKLATQYTCKTMAIPCISTGIFGFPKEKAAIIAIRTIITFLQKDSILEKINLVAFDKENFDILSAALANY